MKKLLFFTLPSVLLMSIIGCSKDGATGPAGATGATGATGSSIVAVADSFYAPSASWVAVSGSIYQFTYTNSNITQKIVSKGTIDVALWYTPQSYWIALNDYFPGSGAGFRYFYKLNTLILEFDGPSAPPSYSYKAVLIPGSVIEQNPNSNLKDWNQAITFINSQKN